MLRFLSWQAHQAQHGAKLSFSDDVHDSKFSTVSPFLRPRIYVVLGCQNLLALQLGVFLSDDETQTILGHVPVGIQHIVLHASMHVVASPNWKRLINIVGAQLHIGSSNQELIEAKGLAALASLH